MGCKGSLHFYGKSEEVIKIIFEEYANPHSVLNRDPAHNGYGTPMIVVNDNFISIYDGSFAACGDLYMEAEFLSAKVGKPVMGITFFGEMYGLFCTNRDKTVTEALSMDGDWLNELDARVFLDTLFLPYETYQIEEILDVDDVEDFLAGFQKLTNLPVFLSEKDIDLSHFLRLDKSSELVNVYTKIKEFSFLDNGSIG